MPQKDLAMHQNDVAMPQKDLEMPQKDFVMPQKDLARLGNPRGISKEADFGCFSKSLQKERTANPSEILSRTHPSKLQTEP